MSKLKEFRAKYPEYSSVPDDELLKALHQKYYSQVPYEQFTGLMGATKPAEVERQSGFLRGLKDPITGGAQLLTSLLPSGVVEAGNKLNNYIADKTGLVAKLPEGGVDQMAQQEEAAYQAGRGTDSGFDWARLAGNVFNPANLAVGARAVQGARALGAGKLAQSVAGGAAGGAVTPSLRGEDKTFAEDKLGQIATGALLGPVGEVAVGGAGKVLSSAKTAAQQQLSDMGVQLTPGMLMGGKFKEAEEFLQNTPLAGAAIRDAREKATVDFNKAILNRALGHIDEKLTSPEVGRTAIKEVSSKVEKAYDNALKDMSIRLDPNLGNKLLALQSQANKKLTEAQASRFDTIIKSEVIEKLSKGVSGSDIKFSLEAKLNKRIKDYLASPDPDFREVGEYLLKVKDSVRDALERQNPKETVAAYRKADAAKADLYRIEQASVNAGSDNGVFNPKAFYQAVKAKDPTRGKSATAKGEARLQQEAEAALEVIGSNDTSGLARYGLGLAGGYAVASNPKVAIPTALASYLAYTPKGLKAAETALTKRPESFRKAGKVLQDYSSYAGPGITTPGLFQYNIEDRNP